MSLIAALRAAVDEFWSARYFADWEKRRGIFAAIDTLDEAWNDRPDDRGPIEDALTMLQQMLHELNARATR